MTIPKSVLFTLHLQDSRPAIIKLQNIMIYSTNLQFILQSHCVFKKIT